MRNLTAICPNLQNIMRICLLLLMLMTFWIVGIRERKGKQHYHSQEWTNKFQTIWKWRERDKEKDISGDKWTLRLRNDEGLTTDRTGGEGISPPSDKPQQRGSIALCHAMCHTRRHRWHSQSGTLVHAKLTTLNVPSRHCKGNKHGQQEVAANDEPLCHGVNRGVEP